MALKSYELKDQLTRPDPKVRLYVFAGPDEAGSRKLMATRVAALGDGAECVDLSPAQLKDDPARLGALLARSYAELPAEAVKYVRRIEELVEAPVVLLSTSPERDDTIVLRDPFAG